MKPKSASTCTNWLPIVAPLPLCLLLLASCLPISPPASTPTHTPTLTPSPTLTSAHTPTPPHSPTPAPTFTPTPPPVPTLDPAAVASIVAKGQARLKAMGVEPLCLRWEDTDGDGEPEWVGLYHRPGEPPQLAAFVLDGEAWHDLQPLKKEPGKEDFGLGEYPTCELEVRDTNADGRVEILVWGHAETRTDLLHVFVWDGTAYALLAGFEGEAGVRLENTDGDLADEIAVGYNAGNDLVWEAVHTWDGANYAWTWERYAWFYLDRPHAYHTDTPEHVVISFYLAVDDRDLPGAYGLLSGSAQAVQPYQTWAAGFATTVAVEAGAVHELARSGETATVTAQVRAYDNVAGRIVVTLWDVEWAVVQTEAGWRLGSAAAGQLDQWELPYYP